MMISFLNKLRFRFLSPDSRFELWLRTLYHRVMASRIVFKIQDYLAIRSYTHWKAKQLEESIPETVMPTPTPKIIFMVFGVNADPKALRDTLESILKLHRDNWEVLIIKDSRSDENNTPKVFSTDQKVSILDGEVSSLSEVPRGEYILICQAGDIFYPSLLDHFYQHYTHAQNADVFYFDIEIIDENTGKLKPVFKPGMITTHQFLSVNYLSRSIIRRSAFDKIADNFFQMQNFQLFDYQLCLRLCEKYTDFDHISKVLIKQTTLSNPANPQINALLCDHLSESGCENATSVDLSNQIRFTWKTGDPSVDILILTKNNQHFLEPLLASIKEKTETKNYRISIVDNGSDDPGTLAFYHEIMNKSEIRIIPYPKAFNYSDAINLGVSQTDSDLLLFMNDDMLVKTPGWLTELTRWATRPDVGVVGAKLLRANHTIQHAGIIIGLSGFVGHLYLNASEHYSGLMGSVDWYHNFLAVTGALQMVRRTIFDQVGGYDQGFELAFGDIDFCLRVHEFGYQNVYTPFAQLYHFEGSTRGYSTPAKDALRGFDKFQSYLIKGDPFFSPNLSYSRIPRCKFNLDSEENLEQLLKERKMFYLGK